MVGGGGTRTMRAERVRLGPRVPEWGLWTPRADSVKATVRGRLGSWGWPRPFLAVRGSLGLASPH